VQRHKFKSVIWARTPPAFLRNSDKLTISLAAWVITYGDLLQVINKIKHTNRFALSGVTILGKKFKVPSIKLLLYQCQTFAEHGMGFTFQ